MMDTRVLLILGASSDLGYAYIEKYGVRYDYILAHCNHTMERLLELKKQIGDKLRIYKADFLDEDSTKEFMDKIDEDNIEPTHIVYLPAPNLTYNKFSKIAWDNYLKSFELQLRPLITILHKFLPDMAGKKYGKLVFVLSSCVVNEPPKYMADYVTVKYALLGLMKSLAVDYADKELNINAISPSMIETKFLKGISDLMIQKNAMNSPLKRNAVVDDIIPVIHFLLSEESNFMTGQNVVVAGGTVI